MAGFDLLRKLAATIVLVVLIALHAVAADQAAVPEPAPDIVKGHVFLDANRNGQRDPGEKGLAGIRVSDGVQIIETDADGAYSVAVAEDKSIPYKPARVVNVCWPGGKWPSGRWWARLGDMKDASNVDFGLRDDEQPQPFVFLHMSDNHDSGGIYPRMAVDAKRMMPLARFIVNSGDMGYATVEGSDEMFRGIAEKAKALPMPIMHIPGNHDIAPGEQGIGEGKNPLAHYGGYTKYLGPVRWSFDYGGCHFVGVDWGGPYGPFLAADRKSVKDGTRTFTFVHYRSGAGPSTHQFYGHTHIQARKGGSTAVASPLGDGTWNVVVVSEDGKSFDLIERCAGCKVDNPTYHSRSRCQIRDLTYDWGKAIAARRQKQNEAVKLDLSDGVHLIQSGQAAAYEFEIVFSPLKAKRSGLRFGADAPVDVAIEGGLLMVDKVPVPYMPHDEIKNVTLHGVIEGGRLELYVDSLMHMARTVKVGDPSRLSLFAEGGKATFEKATVWELKGR